MVPLPDAVPAAATAIVKAVAEPYSMSFCSGDLATRGRGIVLALAFPLSAFRSTDGAIGCVVPVVGTDFADTSGFAVGPDRTRRSVFATTVRVLARND